MKRRLREYKKEKRMWCRYVAGAMALMMLAVSVPATSAFGLENDEEEQATILTYKETDEGMVVDQFIPTEEAKASWEEGFEQAKAELEAEGYENITDASDENSMVYVGGEDYVVPVTYVADEEKDTIPLEMYDGEGGEHYLWKYVKAEKTDEGIVDAATSYFLIRSGGMIALNEWKKVTDDLGESETDEQYKEIEAETPNSNIFVGQSDDIVSENFQNSVNTSALSLRANGRIANELSQVFDDSAIKYDPASAAGIIRAKIDGNMLFGWNPTGEAINASTFTTGDGRVLYIAKSTVLSKKAVSLRSEWTMRFRPKFALEKKGQVLTSLRVEGVASATASADYNWWAGYESRIDIIPSATGQNNIVTVSNNHRYFDGSKECTVQYRPNGSGGSLTISTGGASKTLNFANVPADANLEWGTQVNWLLSEGKAAYPKNPVNVEFVSFNYDDYNPIITGTKWYKADGTEITKNTQVTAGEQIRVEVTGKNDSTNSFSADVHYKVSDDASQAFTQNISTTDSGLEGEGTGLALTNSERKQTFYVTAAKSVPGSRLALGLMMEDDFFHEKQYIQLQVGAYMLNYDANKPSDASDVTVVVPDSYSILEEEAAEGFGAVDQLESNYQKIFNNDKSKAYAFKEWNTAADGTGTIYAPGDTIPGPITESMKLYAIWEETTMATLTYHANTPEGALSAGGEAVTVPEPEKAITGNYFTAVALPSSTIVTADDTDYEFKGWAISETAAAAGTVRYGYGDMIRSSVTDGVPNNIELWGIWKAQVAETCPFTLDVSAMTVKDKNGATVASPTAAHAGYSYTAGSKTLTINGAIFAGQCIGNSAHDVHAITVTGTNPEASVTFASSGETEADTAYRVIAKGVTAKALSAAHNSDITFNGKNVIGGDATRALALNQGGSVFLDTNAEVTVYATGSGTPVSPASGEKFALLNLTMAKPSDEAASVTVAGAVRTIPANALNVSFLDNKNGIWLTTTAANMKIQTADGTIDYVSGRSQESYKKTFELGDNSVGTYSDVRIPTVAKQLAITVPSRVVFNVYTEGADNANGDHGFIAPVYQLKNNSYVVEDTYQFAEADGTVKQMEFGKSFRPVSVNYQGLSQSAEKESDYSLRSYEEIDEDTMNTTVRKNPIVCLEAEGIGTDTTRISLDQQKTLDTPVQWFTAVPATGETGVGISRIQFKVPDAFTDGSSTKPWYQIPIAVTEEDYRLYGHHVLKLGFVLE